MSWVKALLIVIVALVLGRAFAYGVTSLTRQAPPNKPITQYSKAEYADAATRNCAADGNAESYCRCFYEGLLADHTVAEVLEIDVSAHFDPDYEFTEPQLRLALKCMD